MRLKPFISGESFIADGHKLNYQANGFYVLFPVILIVIIIININHLHTCIHAFIYFGFLIHK